MLQEICMIHLTAGKVNWYISSLSLFLLQWMYFWWVDDSSCYILYLGLY